MREVHQSSVTVLLCFVKRSGLRWASATTVAKVATVLLPIPDRDFDPTEVAVSWQVLSRDGHRVVFATQSGAPAHADDIMVTGRGLDFWSAVPGLGRLTVVGRLLRANADARAAYALMQESAEYRMPIGWSDATLDNVDALLLPGGHRRRGMRSYIESPVLQGLVVDAFRRALVVAAICHGVLLAARCVDPATGRSVLHGRKTTSLTWELERRAWRIARITRFWDPTYYRTYSENAGQSAGYMSVQAEVTRALEDPADFRDVDRGSPHWRMKTSGLTRDTAADSRPAFVVDDGVYVSARWPGDTHTFAKALSDKLIQAH
jgi:putative intracellular protease/amidase